MRKRNALFCVCVGACLLVFTTGFATAQTDTASNDRQATSPGERSGDSEVVYTTESLNRLFAGSGVSGEAVYTNEYLNDQAAEPDLLPDTAYTNEYLKERFGSEVVAGGPTPAQGAESQPENEGGAAEASEGGEVPSEPAMSPEERAQRIAEIDSELERLDKRLLAIRNPLLAGTVPSTDEERADEKGMDNLERLRRTEAKIDELKAALDELRAATEGDDK